MKRHNLTVQLDEDVIRKAKILAARRSTSISKLIGAEIERLVENDDAYQQAKERALARMKRGYHFGGPPYPKRDELYDRTR
jgi:predicted transcriptional regulator